MQMPPAATSPGRLLDAGSFTSGRLNSAKKARPLLSTFAPQQQDLKLANVAFVDAEDAVNMAKGPVVEVDTEARELLTDLELDAFKFVKKNRADPYYKALIPNGLSASKKLAGSDMATELKRVGERVKDLPAEHPLHGYGAKIGAVVKAYVEPLKGLAAALTVQGKASTALKQAKVAWLLAYDSLYGALRNLFPRRKSHVESFFKRFGRGNTGGSGNSGGGGGEGGGGGGGDK